MKSKDIFLFLLSILIVFVGYKLYKIYETDKIAQCLTEKKAVFYGAKWCEHCNVQKLAFGSSFKYVDYFECSKIETTPQLQECFDKEIKRYPTWIFSDGSKLEGLQKVETLAQKTGCN